jgi:7-cyano-7-deazaguanine synthase
VFERSRERGGDSWGIWSMARGGVRSTTGAGEPPLPNHGAYIGYRRGEPAHEWIKEKTTESVQPFEFDEWVVVHNGTISNDMDLIRELTGIGHPWTLDASFHTREGSERWIDSMIIPRVFMEYGFEEGLMKLQGSFAIIAIRKTEPDKIYWATNYKPLFLLGSQTRSFTFASQSKYFHGLYNPYTGASPIELGPYQWGVLHDEGRMLEQGSLYAKQPYGSKVLVVCSGGLDSGTAAFMYHKSGFEVTLLHFAHRSRAQEAEESAIHALAEAMGDAPIRIVETDFWVEHANSVLTNREMTIADAQVGGQTSTEWTPARNTVFAAQAMAIAEADGYDYIAFGTNQEESSAGFADNEQEWVNKLRALAPYAMKPYHQVKFLDPFAGAMKHDIVTSGQLIGMPFELTYSCYTGESQHCGQCGPCSYRHLAFEMAGVEDPTVYTKPYERPVVST